MAKNKIKVPKRIGGVKVPKAIRKAPVVTALLNNRPRYPGGSAGGGRRSRDSGTRTPPPERRTAQ